MLSRLVALALIIASVASATDYQSHLDKTGVVVEAYTATKDTTWRYLGFRDISRLLCCHSTVDLALDYGCGTGMSSRLLRSLGYHVKGVDVSPTMLQQAKVDSPDLELSLLTDGTLPFDDETFDLVFSSLVLFEIGSKEDLKAYMAEACRVLKPEGIFVALTGSAEGFTGNWACFDTSFPENPTLKSGDLGRVKDLTSGIVFTDYYWTVDDYNECLEEAGMQLVEVHSPLGEREDSIEWLDEWHTSPVVILVARPALD